MARIPVYDQPRVQERGLPNAFQQGTNNVRAFTGGAEQIAELGTAVVRSGQQFDQIADRVIVEQVNKTDAEITSGWLKWEAENRPKFVGENAKNFQAEADKWWQEAKGTYRQNLNPMALQRLNQTLGQRYDRAMAGVISYQADQMDRHTVSTIESRINSDVEWGVTTGDTGAAALRVRETAEQLAVLRRWAPEQKDEYIRGKLDAMHGARTVAIARDDATKAEEYLRGAVERGEVSAIRTEQLRGTIKAAGEEQTGQRNARLLDPAMSYSEKLRAAAQEENPRIRAAMEATITADYQMQERIKREEVGKMVGNLQTRMYSTGRVPSAVEIEELRQIDPEAAGSFTREVAAYRKANAERATTGSVRTDMGSLSTLYNMPPEEFSKVNLAEYQDRLSESDMRTMIKRQADMRNPEKLPDVLTATQQVNNHPVFRSITNKERQGEMLTAYGQDINAFVQENKREPNYAERQAILDQLTIKVNEGFFSRTRYGFQLTPEERRARSQPAAAPTPAAPAPAAARQPVGTIRAIPGPVRGELTAALRQRGIAVTEDNLQRAYAAMIGAQ